MSSLSNIRVYTRRKYKELYRELRANRPVSPRVFPDNRELFMLCSALGFKAGKRNKLEHKEEIIRSNFADHQETVLQLIALRAEPDKGLDILDDPDLVIHIAEEYADAGMEILVEHVLRDYIVEKDEQYTVVYTEKDMLHKQLLHFIDSELNNGPFA